MLCMHQSETQLYIFQEMSARFRNKSHTAAQFPAPFHAELRSTFQRYYIPSTTTPAYVSYLIQIFHPLLRHLAARNPISIRPKQPPL